MINYGLNLQILSKQINTNLVPVTASRNNQENRAYGDFYHFLLMFFLEVLFIHINKTQVIYNKGMNARYMYG